MCEVIAIETQASKNIDYFSKARPASWATEGDNEDFQDEGPLSIQYDSVTQRLDKHRSEFIAVLDTLEYTVFCRKSGYLKDFHSMSQMNEPTRCIGTAEAGSIPRLQTILRSN